MKKRVKFVIILALVFIAGISAVLIILKNNNMRGKPIKVSGNIEGDDVRISFRVDGQIIELLTDEGKVIKKGDIVARLNTDELSKVKANAEAALKAAHYDFELSKLDYERAEKLLKAGAISVQQRDTAKTKFDADRSDVEQLTAQLELADTRLGFADLASPLDGFILVKSSLAGEVVQPGTPVFTAVDLHNIWVTAYINETDLGRVKLNQEAYVTTDTYPGKKYKGRLSFVSSEAEFTPKFIQTQEERVKLVFGVKVMVKNINDELKPGMPTDVKISLK